MRTSTDLIAKFRWLIIVGFIAITVILAMQIPRAEIDADMKNQLPDDIGTGMSRLSSW